MGKATKSRYFVINDTAPKHFNCNVVIGRQIVTYEADYNADVYGTTEIEILFPIKKQLKNSFPLSMFPVERSVKDNAKNIEPVDVAVNRLFIEANKAAKLLAQSVLIKHTGDRKYTVDYKDMQIIEDEMLDDSQEIRMRGIVVRRKCYLRRGDIVGLTFLQDEPWMWYIKYNPHDHGTSVKEKLRKFFMRLFNKGAYEARYVFDQDRTMSMSIEDIYVTGSDIEPID